MNGVHENVEEPNPYHLTSKGKASIQFWDTWVSLCKDDSAKEKITTLFLSVADEKKDKLEITGFKNLKKLVIQKRSFQKVREIKIHGLENLTEVFITLIPAFLIPLFRFHPYSFKSFPDCSLYSLVSNTGALSLLRSSIVVISPLLAGIGNDAYRIVDHV